MTLLNNCKVPDRSGDFFSQPFSAIACSGPISVEMASLQLKSTVIMRGPARYCIIDIERCR